MQKLAPTKALLDRRVTLGKRIRAQRVAKNISQEELAHLAGLDRSYVGHVERGEQTLGIDNLHRLADALGCEARDLI